MLKNIKALFSSKYVTGEKITIMYEVMTRRGALTEGMDMLPNMSHAAKK